VNKCNHEQVQIYAFKRGKLASEMTFILSAVIYTAKNLKTAKTSLENK
jgi:hypothetical protein